MIIIHIRLSEDNTPEIIIFVLTYYMSLPNLHNFIIKIKGYNTEIYWMRVYITKFHFDRRTWIILSLFNCGALKHIHPHPCLGY